MTMFRKLYYKLVTLFCMIACFFLMFENDNAVVFKGCFCIFVGFLSFGSWAIGRETIDPDKPLRNILMLLVWSLVGFGIMTIGISLLVDERSNSSVILMFLVLGFFALIIAYLISIIKNKDWYAILSIVLFIGGLVVGGFANGIFIVGLLSLLILAAAIGCFVYSIIKGLTAD